ncbi:uncharacterized protein METZ01_LOCUS65487, partial [marine metagenome]
LLTLILKHVLPCLKIISRITQMSGTRISEKN